MSATVATTGRVGYGLKFRGRHAPVPTKGSLLARSRRGCERRIDMQEPPHGFRVSNKARTYCQDQLWRCLDLVEGAETLRLAGHELGTMLMVRAIYETVAAFVHFERKFASTMRPLEAEEDLKRIYEFIHAKTFATRKENLLAKIGENEAVKATQVLNQIDEMKKIYPAARDDYDFLCEFAHPNAFGGRAMSYDFQPVALIRRKRCSGAFRAHISSSTLRTHSIA